MRCLLTVQLSQHPGELSIWERGLAGTLGRNGVEDFHIKEEELPKRL